MEEERFDFENLKVYQKALDYIDFVYEITRGFPKEEVFSLTDQLKRASISILPTPNSQLRTPNY
jgi:hypothetical protein